MKITYFLPVASISLASAYPALGNAPHPMFPRAGEGRYMEPGPGDVRSPCPALNALANLGHIPRSGKGLTFDVMVDAIINVLGVGSVIAKSLSAAALTMANDTPCKSCDEGDFTRHFSVPHFSDFSKASIGDKILKNFGKRRTSFGVREDTDWDEQGNPTLDLNRLQKHDKIEHDASLVRQDTFEGNNTICDPALLKEFLSLADSEGYITKEALAKFRHDRYHEAKASNPRFKFGIGNEEVKAFGESALLIGTFGDPEHDFDLKADVVSIFFGQERLPQGELWEKRPTGKELGFTELIYYGAYLKKHAGIFDS